MTIKVSDLNKTQGRFVRETTAPFIISEGGEDTTVKIRVKYQSRSVKESKAIQTAIQGKENAGQTVSMAEILLPVLVELPDLTDDNDKPAPITLELLESINVINLNAMHQAIAQDLVPKAQPPK